ncbi:MAG: hypothetical protein ACD_75C02602G0002 [uncultured bacterium]|nr:MAG: hypothetical protein ACD_75C02602G0002 [uncultured bacterium]
MRDLARGNIAKQGGAILAALRVKDIENRKGGNLGLIIAQGFPPGPVDIKKSPVPVDALDQIIGTIKKGLRKTAPGKIGYLRPLPLHRVIS